MTDLILREANLSDIEALCRLYFEFHEFHVRGVPERLVTQGSPPEFDDSELSANLKKLLDDEDMVIFVAEVGGQGVGLAEVYLCQDEAHPMRVT